MPGATQGRNVSVQSLRSTPVDCLRLYCFKNNILEIITIHYGKLLGNPVSTAQLQISTGAEGSQCASDDRRTWIRKLCLEIPVVEHHFPEYFPIDPEQSPLGKQSSIPVRQGRCWWDMENEFVWKLKTPKSIQILWPSRRVVATSAAVLGYMAQARPLWIKFLGPSKWIAPIQNQGFKGVFSVGGKGIIWFVNSQKDSNDVVKEIVTQMDMIYYLRADAEWFAKSLPHYTVGRKLFLPPCSPAAVSWK